MNILTKYTESDMQPSLDVFVTPESWLVFQMLGHSMGQVNWMLYPQHWGIYSDYQEFKAFVKNIAVVNDAGERAVKAVPRFSDADHQ